MSADNSVTRSARDVEAEAGEAGFSMPPDLADRYDVRVIAANDASERRIGMFLPADRENPSIEVSGNGDRIVARNEDPETIAALVKIAKHNGWEGIDVDGSPAFRQAVWEAGSRAGLTVRGYEPSFDAQARMADLRHADDTRREREAASKPVPVVEQVAPVTAVAAIEATIPARSADIGRDAATEASPAQGGAELSDADKRLLLRLSAYTQDHKALSAGLTTNLDPMERAFRYERLDVNKEALNGALEQALESPTLVSAFSKAGYEPDDLRRMARDGEWDGEVADAVYRVRTGLHRDVLDVETGHKIDEIKAAHEDRRVTASTAAPDRQPEPAPQIVREERLHGPAAARDENDELAELFLRGSAEQIAADPRLANAIEAQAAMDRHIGVAFEGDAERMMSASLESRELISDVLRRGLDVSVREPTPVRQIEPIQPAPDLER